MKVFYQAHFLAVFDFFRAMAYDTIPVDNHRRTHFSSTPPLRGTANKPDPPVWLVCNIKINVSAEYTQGATKGLLNQKLSLSSHIYRSR